MQIPLRIPQARLLVWALAFFSCCSAAFAMEDWEVRHLLSRAGLGVSPAEYLRFKPMTFEQGVDALLAAARTYPTTTPPEWIHEPAPDRSGLRGMEPEARQMAQREIQREQNQNGQDLKNWWYGEMLATKSPLTERMTLFWHNHFVSSLQKVKEPRLMYRQISLLRANALGNLRVMTLAVAQDPAMIIYLDNASNRKAAPNENFARELMELFTLGEGHYNEQDIKESARAFTGWNINRGSGTYQFLPRQHDAGGKTFMGQTGMLGGEDVIEIIFQQPRAAQFIVDKMWREFISPTPDPAESARLAMLCRAGDFEIKPLVRAILLSPAFRAEANRGALVKSPVDLMVGAMRMFDLDPEDQQSLVRYGRMLGQDLLDPPNVKGWPGGDAWIDSNTFLLRQQMVSAMTSVDSDRREMEGGRRGGRRGRRGGGQPQSQQAPSASAGDEMMMQEQTAAPAAAQQRRGGNRRGGPMAMALPNLKPDDRKLAERVMALRRGGSAQPQIVETLVKEGYPRTALRDLNDKVSQISLEMQANGQAPAEGGRGGRRGGAMQMPRIDAQAWLAKLSAGGRSPDWLALLLAVPPVEAKAAPDSAAGIVALLRDPAYQLK